MNDLLYVCSPYRGDTKRNKEYARKLTRAALENGFVPVTVHLYLTEATDDQNPEERSRGMAAGTEKLFCLVFGITPLNPPHIINRRNPKKF